ncbi:hypothetical protein GCM10010307_39340 [Streptomyces vastus]|uniref:Uncharacterized protein n=1 Tax=Streptomyces vastus TaxID=285451 RepID=A0ABN3R2E5_9ACTN
MVSDAVWPRVLGLEGVGVGEGLSREGSAGVVVGSATVDGGLGARASAPASAPPVEQPTSTAMTAPESATEKARERDTALGTGSRESTQ